MKIIFVTGVARSGTSAMAGLLERMGAATLPKTVAGQWNPDYQENQILNALCTSIHPWHKPQIKHDRTIYERAIATLFAQYQENPVLVVKCPSFPFMIPELRQVVALMRDQLGIDVSARFVFIRRNRADQVKSLNAFTNNVWSKQHWETLLDIAGQCVANNKLPGDLHFSYDGLLEHWDQVATAIAKLYPELTVPEDGGIRPELNHYQGATSAINLK